MRLLRIFLNVFDKRALLDRAISNAVCPSVRMSVTFVSHTISHDKAMFLVSWAKFRVLSLSLEVHLE